MNILGITFYRITGREIAEDYQKSILKEPSFQYKKSIFPSFVFIENNDNNLNFTYSEDYFQFFTDPNILDETQSNQEYILFDVTMTDAILGEEISNVGAEEFLRNINFEEYSTKNLKDFMIHKYDYRGICLEQFFDIDYIVHTYDTVYGTEYDTSIKIKHHFKGDSHENNYNVR